MRALWLLPLLGGCGTNLLGWWDLVEWEVSRDGTTEVVHDAGFLTWQQEGSSESFAMVLSYQYDPVAVDLLPDPDPDLGGSGPNLDDIEWTDEGEPDLSFGVPTTVDDYFPVDFDVVADRGGELELESTYTLDGSAWRWVLRR